MTKRQVAQHKPLTTMAVGGPLPRPRPTRAQGGLAGLLASASASAAALALATMPQQARAQSAVNATPTGVNATVTQSATFDQVTVSGSQATVDWALNPTGVSTGVFLNGGTQLDFQGSGSYTVLNRVNPMSLIGTLALNGSVTSSPQGKIWFYNPGGWVVGSGGNIDVGSLVLTSSPITETAFDPDNPNTTGLYGAGGTIRFGQAAAGSSVTNNGSISARNDGSYIALVAPRVVQAGSVSTNGTTAYAAVGAADVTINNGLFDIVVTGGTDDAQGIVHTGTTERFAPNSSSATPQSIYLVAVPKNDAMTMLVSGNIGYNSASSASQSGGKIVLSAGYDMVGGQPVAGTVAPVGNITLTNLSLQTTTQATAASKITVSADSNNAVFASDDLTLNAGKRVDVVAFGEGGLFVNGALSLNAGSGAKGGIIDVSVDGGAVFRVGGNFDARADGIGAILTDPVNGDALLGEAAGEAATGGSVNIALGDAFYDVGDRTSLSANAQGGLGGASAGSARAGSVSFSSTSLTTLSPNAPLNLQANADATPQQFGAGPATGAGATGGSVDLAFGGSFDAESIGASVAAIANPGQDGAAQNATGGSLSLVFSGAGSTVHIAGVDLTASADAANAGIASGAIVTYKVDGATINSPLPSNGCDGPCPQPSSGISIDNTRSGTGPAAGTLGFSVINGGTLDLAGPFSSINLFSSGAAIEGGTGVGASTSFLVDGGVVNLQSVSIRSNGQGAFDGPRSDGRGGDITVTLRNGGSIDAASDFSLSSRGTGGSGVAAGDGTGGAVLLTIANGELASPFIDIGSFGFAGSQFSGGTRIGTGFGGSAAMNLADPNAVISTDFLSVSAPGQAGGGRAAAVAAFGPIALGGSVGGNGQGGTASITMDDGSVFVSSSLSVDASGTGGDGFDGGDGGSGRGGTATFAVNGGNTSLSSLAVTADGRGGFGASFFGEGNPAGNGGAGTGGIASLLQSGGGLTVNSITLSATGNAEIPFGEGGTFGGGGSVFGDGPATGGTGGAGKGGDTTLSLTGGSLANISGAPVNSITLDSRGVGGGGGNAFSNSSSSQLTRGSGGTGRGGNSTVLLTDGSADFQSLSLDASGSGGFSGQERGRFSDIPSNGGKGGSGFGGIASITLGTPISAQTNFESTRSYSASVGGFGANGGDGVIGGAGGDGQGGSATLTVTSPDVFVDQFSLDAYSYGGAGGSSGLANNGGAGGKGTGGTAEIVADGGGVAFTAVNGSIDVSGEGGFGGTGGSGQVETLDAAGNGGNAGAGFGGTVRFSANNGSMIDLTQLGNLEFYAYGSGGNGGDGGNAEFNSGSAIGNGGNGGDGTGGSIEIGARDGTVRLGTFVTTANGDAGSGGGRLNADGNSTDASNGGSGGNGFGGNVSLTASGSGGSIQAISLDIRVDGQGGSGADARGYDPVTFIGASGGSGGAGTGGTIGLDSFDGATITIDVGSTLTANGTAAFGGVGADGGTNPISGVGGNGGRGGNSGQGNGGTVSLDAEGGLIETGDISVSVNGFGAAGRQGGQGGTGIVPPGPVTVPPTPPAPNGAPGAGGFGGGGVGGAVFITAQRDEGGSVGGLDLGAVNLDLTGYFDFGDFTVTDASGKAEIVDRVDESNGGVSFASLDVQGRGDSFANPITLSIYSQETPIRVTGGLGAGTGGVIDIVAAATGGLEIGGQLSLGTDSSIRVVGSQLGLIHARNINWNARGQTLISAQNCTGPLCAVVGADDQFLIFSGGDIALLGPALIEAGGFLQASSDSNVTGEAGSGYRAPNIFVSAENDVTVRNASGGGLDVQSGLVLGEGGGFYVNGNVTLGEADGSGIFDLSGNLNGVAGTSFAVLAGTTIDTGNAIEIVAGDDIRIGANATITNATSGSEPGFIRLAAGGLVTDGSYPAGNVASLLIGNGATIDGTGGSLTLSGGAIDGRGAIFRGADFTSDVVNPPAAGMTQRNDNGQLTSPCLEGDICLGAIAATGVVRIGQGTSAPVTFTGTGNIAGASVAITTRETLTYGAAASPFTISSPGAIALTSQEGNIALAGSALIDGGTVALSAATGSVTGNGRLRSAGDIGIDVASNISLASLVAGRQLTTVAGIGGALEPLYTLPGNLAITSLQTGALTAIRAGGSIVIGTATTGGNGLSLTAGTFVFLGTDSNVSDLTLDARDVSFAAVTANGNIVLSSTNAISGTSAIAGGTLQANGATLNATTLRSGAAMSLTTSGATTLGTATAGGDLVIDSGALAFTGLTSTGSTAINAASIAGGTIAAGTSLNAQAGGAIVLGSASAGSTLALDGATIDVDTLTSGGDMTLSSTGTAQIGSADAGGALTATTGDLAFDSLSSGGATRIDAANVDGGDIDAGTSLAIASPGAISLGSAVAGETLDLDGATIDAAVLTSGGATTLTSSGTTALGTADSGGDLSIDSGALSFATLTSDGAMQIDATAIAGGNIAAGTSLTARAIGTLVLGTASAGTTLALDGASLRATMLTSGGNMTLTSSGAAQLGTVGSGGSLTATTGDLAFTRLASTGATTIRASSVTGGDIAAGTALSAFAPGAVRIGAAGAGTSLTLSGGTIDAASLTSGGTTSLTSSGATTLGRATAGTTFTATSGAFQFTGINAGGDSAITASTVVGGDATSNAGAFRITATGTATLGRVRAGTDVTAQATTLTFAGIEAGRDVTLDVTTLSGTGIVTARDLTIRSVNDLTFESIAAGRNLSLNASQGAITLNTDIDAGGTVLLIGDAILIKAVGPLTVARVTADNGDIAITTDGLLQVANAAARGDVTLTSTANSLILGPIVAGRSLATPQALNSSGTSKGTPGPGAITLSAAQAITLQGTVDALTALAATAGTLIDQRSLAVGKTIAYRSADLTLGQTAALGQSNFTTSIALTNTGSTGALLGEISGTASGYRLDNAEFGRIHSGGDASLAAGSSLTVGTLSASAASGSGGVADGNIGATSALALATSGDLSVGGALSLGNATGNTLRLSSGSLTLDAGAGSVRLVEGSGHGGTLAIATGELSALTGAARTAIVGMDGNVINLRLAQNDGVTDGRTLLEAGAISISASGRVLIQNTALGQTFDARRGFVADTFAISTSGSTQSTSSTGNPLIVINGTVAGTTGLTALRLVKVTGGYDDLSTVNGCRLFTATCGTPQFDPIQDVLEEEIGRGSNLDSGDAIGEGSLILIDRFEPLGFEAVIDEPVTGSGNDDFLVPEAGTGDQECTADDETKCEKPPAG